MSQMSTALSVKLAADPVRTLAFGSIIGTYVGVGTSFSKPIRMLYVLNTTDALLMFSLDGINDHFPLIASGYIMLDIATNKTLDKGFYLAEGSRIYVKQIGAPGSGSVYVSTFFGATV